LALLYTIGHSTRSLDDLVETLQAQSIETLVDIRAFPMSRRLPQFNRESLEKSLPAAGIRYVWMKTLGGYRRKSREDSPNVALRNESFRNYADYMLSREFESAMAELISLAEASRTACEASSADRGSAHGGGRLDLPRRPTAVERRSYDRRHRH
jgi:uncharacterized protein (DUF488 family)